MKLLVILSRIPYPLEKGDKLRAFYQIKELSKRHHIYLCCLSDEKPHPKAAEVLSEIATEVHFLPLKKPLIYWQLFWAWFGNKPFQVAYFYQRKPHQKIKEIIRKVQPDHIFCQLIRTAEYAKNEHTYPKTLDYQDAFSKGMTRRAEKEKNFFKKTIFKTEARRLLHYEHVVFELFENKSIISEQDRSHIYHPRQKEITVVGNGVDPDFFHPQDLAKKYDLCFIGNMGYPPNVDSTLYLVNKVMPILLKTRPDLKLLISGATPAESILKLQSENVTVAGWVDDIRTSYASSRIFIAPMQIGTGLQNKLLEAMSMKIPCITSPLANNALGATHQHQLLVAKQPEEYAEAVLYLLDNPDQAKQMAEQAHRFVTENYTWQSSTQKLERMMMGKPK